MTEARKHVLIWVKQEFLQSPGMLQILKETGIFSHPEEKWRELAEAAEVTGGFALSGKLVSCDHPAGVWISPPGGKRIGSFGPVAFRHQFGDRRGAPVFKDLRPDHGRGRTQRTEQDAIN